METTTVVTIPMRTPYTVPKEHVHKIALDVQTIAASLPLGTATGMMIVVTMLMNHQNTVRVKVEPVSVTSLPAIMETASPEFISVMEIMIALIILMKITDTNVTTANVMKRLNLLVLQIRLGDALSVFLRSGSVMGIQIVLMAQMKILLYTSVPLHNPVVMTNLLVEMEDVLIR